MARKKENKSIIEIFKEAQVVIKSLLKKLYKIMLVIKVSQPSHSIIVRSKQPLKLIEASA